MLHGRDVERARLAELLRDADAGRSAVVVVLGEPGVGKSALLDQLQRAASGFRVLRTQGLESEAPLAFAALHRLLRPVTDLFPKLPAPQAHALQVAFGLQMGKTIQPFLVALATLSVLGEAAESAPVLCIVDDAHWLDAASRDALLFSARRLTHERIAFVLAARSTESTGALTEGLATLTLAGLDEAAAAAVVTERYGQLLGGDVVDALLAQTGGNALALVELPGTLSAAQLAGTEALPARLPLTQAVERVFLDRVRRLDEQAQTLMLVAAADDSGRLRLVGEAARRLGAGADALTAAEQAHLVVTDADHIRVAHPLVRSATYQAATGGERRAVHQALAAVLGDAGDTERRAWHLAASVDGPDDDAADALRATAARAELRGGHAAAAAAFDRAAELSADAAVRARSLFDAARNFWLSGQAARATSTAEAAREGSDERILRADIDRLRGRIEVNVGSAAMARRLFVDAARAVAADDPDRALEMTVAATLLSVFDAEAGVDAAADSTSALSTTAAGEGDSVLHLLLQALHAEADGRPPDAHASLHAAAARSGQLAPEQRGPDRTQWRTSGASEPDIIANLGNTAIHLGHDAIARDSYLRVLSHGRSTAAVPVVLYALPRLALPQMLLGQWTAVQHGAHEAVELSRAWGQPALSAGPHAWLALLSALRGDPSYEQHRDDAAKASAFQLGVFANLVRDLQRWAAAATAAAHGEHVLALHQYSSMEVPAVRRTTALDRVVEAVRAEDRGLARTLLDELVGFARASQLPWALAAAEHGQALVAEPAEAAAHFEAALQHHRRDARVVDLARTRLAYGESLRRSGRRVAARAHLRAALAVFEDVGAEPLAARARDELRSSGETARKRDPSTLVALTPMESQVARLVAQGLSNKDVAAQLWISPRTVAFHLRGVFAKAGISSRGALAQLTLA